MPITLLQGVELPSISNPCSIARSSYSRPLKYSFRLGAWKQTLSCTVVLSNCVLRVDTSALISFWFVSNLCILSAAEFCCSWSFPISSNACSCPSSVASSLVSISCRAELSLAQISSRWFLVSSCKSKEYSARTDTSWYNAVRRSLSTYDPIQSKTPADKGENWYINVFDLFQYQMQARGGKGEREGKAGIVEHFRSNRWISWLIHSYLYIFLAFNQIAEVTKNGGGFNHFNLAVKTLDFVEEKADQINEGLTLCKNS